ncbi:hypothetical protein Pcinc_010735 [Petrolisthes cinctipes]|uniref:Uncharacterized protein n=1 Tax=Petrolisthes cinctipes TaxID=88211 RepID=A0AAE1KTD1_PETCI|nr:hypothetical protein Pcinc_010735 [Petrolisthes cinctipes]
MEGTSVEAAARVSPMSQAERSMLIALIEEGPNPSLSKQQHGQHRRKKKKTGSGAPPPEVPKDVEKVLSLIAPEV